MKLIKDFSIRLNEKKEVVVCFTKIPFHNSDFFSLITNISYEIKNNNIHIEYLDVNNETLDMVLINNISTKTIFKLKKNKTMYFLEIGEDNNKVYSGFKK